ncbi:sodium/hydrogen exchanger 11 isoform X10 [Canis lupus baileyi]|uniref:sodium/hydrogen exchanger 11 isoform X10 n=1 Tax=Canis lupus baileyi TaxID=143281 RepID=UPI003B97A88D
MSNTNSSFWVHKEGHKPELLCGSSASYTVVNGHFIMLVCSTIILGGFLKTLLKNSEVTVLMILSLLGFVIGQLAHNSIEVHKIVYPLLKTPSYSLYCYFSPMIIFMAALDVDFCILKNVFWQVLLIGLVSLLMTFIILGYVVLKFNKDLWDLQSSILFSMIVGMTDPVHSVNSLKTIGISKTYTDIIRGESMIICGFTSICFGVFRSDFLHISMFTEFRVILGLCLDILGSIICGYSCSRIIQFILTDLFSNTLTSIILCISMVYMTFYIGESFGMSGMIALVTVGLNFDSLSFKPRIEVTITKFLIMFSSIYQQLIYTFFGIVIGCGETKYLRFHTVVFMLILFATVNFVRLLTIVLVSPLLMHANYEYNWRWGIVIAWSGIKGIFSLLLAPDIHNLADQKVESPQLSSFEKQCNDGILSVEAARILISATKSFCPIQGKDNKFLLFVCHVVFSEEFEYAGHIITVMYIYPMIMHLWPMARELNVSGLISVNNYFVFLYIFQAAMKIISLKRKYFHQYWNTLEFLIMLVGIIDIFCIYFVKLRPDNFALIQMTVILGYFRIIRFIPFIKLIIPLLINIVDVQIKKRLRLMYSITKGYVKSQEDTKLLIKQISSRESVYQKLYEILETNKRDAVKELGLIEHEGRDVVIALKTRQAIRRVIAKALKNLTFLWSRGIIDKHEGIEMNKVFLAKIKALNNFPMAIPPPTPDKYLHNIVWLENKDVLIEFFKERAKLAYFDYGDVICREGEMPQGIYLIISGMAILHSSPPTFGIDSSLRSERGSKSMFTEYCTSGDIIGELSCLLKRETEYTAICETILQACFISLEDLYEGFDVFWPSLEYKIWLKFALSVAYQYFESSLIDEDLEFQKCVTFNLAYVETLSSYNEMTIDNVTMKFVIIVYGSVIDTKTEVPYLAPCILPKTCEQIQGTSDLSKLLVVQPSDPAKNTDDPKVMVSTGLRMSQREYNWKRKYEERNFPLSWNRSQTTRIQLP